MIHLIFHLYNYTQTHVFSQKKDVIPNDEKFTINDDLLESNTLYAIQVRSRPIKEYLVGGVWSEWSESKLVLTSLTGTTNSHGKSNQGENKM